MENRRQGPRYVRGSLSFSCALVRLTSGNSITRRLRASRRCDFSFPIPHGVHVHRLNYFPFLMCLASSMTAAQTETRAPVIPEIATSGRGEIHVTPDQAVLSISVETRSSSAAAAAADNAPRITKAIAAIRAAGVDSAQLTTAGYSVDPDYEKNRQVGLIVRNTLRVELRRIPDIGQDHRCRTRCRRDAGQPGAVPASERTGSTAQRTVARTRRGKAGRRDACAGRRWNTWETSVSHERRVAITCRQG